MKTFITVLAILSFLLGLIIFLSAKGAIHEILGSILFVISAIFISSVGIIGAIEKNKVNNNDSSN